MQIIPKRLPYELLVIAGLSLGSCDIPKTFHASDADRLDVADVNSRNAIARIDALESRVDDLESKLEM
ncbi:hypothetical protein ACFOKI_06650 [Sphingomonas qilianensis]|uniref:Uncharacterized protein n=1 Tax=Sphingomonas qilianensis TaxID=1736690 RepID=A0ABU9XS27_9SPHN